jgi:hypothetical protein
VRSQAEKKVVKFKGLVIVQSDVQAFADALDLFDRQDPARRRVGQGIALPLLDGHMVAATPCLQRIEHRVGRGRSRLARRAAVTERLAPEHWWDG